MSDSSIHAADNPGRFLALVRRGRWEFATRRSGSAVVGIVPITVDGRVLFIEQERPSVGGPVIEFPAGLVGDHGRAEPSLSAARRELFEETGYESDDWREICAGPTSAGLTDECMTFYLASACRRVGPALGDGGEEITLHTVTLDRAWLFLEEARRAGKLVDVKVPGALALALRGLGRA